MKHFRLVEKFRSLERKHFSNSQIARLCLYYIINLYNVYNLYSALVPFLYFYFLFYYFFDLFIITLFILYFLCFIILLCTVMLTVFRQFSIQLYKIINLRDRAIFNFKVHFFCLFCHKNTD